MQLTVYFADLNELYLTDNLPPFGLDVLVDASLDVSWFAFWKNKVWMSKPNKTNYTARNTLNAKIKYYPTERKNFKPKYSCIRVLVRKKISSMADCICVVEFYWLKMFACGRLPHPHWLKVIWLIL